jgi:hypothetical protein
VKSRAAALACVFALACGSKKSPGPADAGTAVATNDAGTPLAPRVILDLSAHPDACVLGHEGVLLDLGAPAARALYGIKEVAALEATEHDGATWDRVSSHTLTFHFAGPIDVDRAEAYVALRVRGAAARRVSVTLNGKLVGTVPLSKGETTIRELHATAATVTNGTNELVLRFGGLGKAPDAAAEIDWIRVGTQADAAYAAPTYDGSVASETLSGVPRRALGLRAPAFVRCTTAMPKGAKLEAQIGLLGKGGGDLEVRVLRDRAAPLSLGKTHVDDAGGWKPLSITLPDEAQGVVALELRADQASPGTRVLVADAKLTAPATPPISRARTARGVVLVVLGQTPSSATSLPTLAALAERSRTFEGHRATSTWAAASVGSMLTGVLPFEHGAEGDASALAGDVVTIGEAAREAGVSTAMFTANPTTSAAFGFARGFQTFKSFFPASEGGGVRVLEEAATWIGAHKSERFLVVVHARGGHPPWEVPADQLKALPPDAYVGPIEPGPHAAEILSRARHVPPLVRFNDADRKRAWALHDYAVSAHDAALGRLLTAIDEAGRKDDTAVIVTSDTGINGSAHVPFGDAEPLDESALASLLVFHSAGETTASHVRAPTSSIDVATTVLAELGLAPPHAFEGEDLATAEGDDGSRALFASTGGHQLVSWMGVLARPTEGQAELCVPALDAACASDAAPLAPLASEALRKLLSDAAKRKRATRVAPALDGPTAAALTAWGR